MKILNLYAGIGGNRKLWTDVEITAVEIEPKIAKIYQDFFPQDKMVIGDAHQYLLEHFGEFDFIWSSPPCPTHSKLDRLRALSNDKKTGGYLAKPQYPDMALYQEILLLKYYFKGKWCVENVASFYEPLIKPTELQRHYFWSNFHIRIIKLDSDNIEDGTRKYWERKMGLKLSNFKIGLRTDTILRNCVRPELGLHILNESKRDIQPELFR